MADRKGHGAADAIRSVKPAVRLILALACLVATAVWAGWLGMMHMAGQDSVLDRAETVTVDLRLLVSGPLPPPAGVVIVAIDDATVNNKGQYPLDRMRLATLINRIAKAGARGVAVDLLLLNKSSASADQALGNALGSVPSVIAGAALFGGQHQSRQPLPIATGVMDPCPVLALWHRSGLSMSSPMPAALRPYGAVGRIPTISALTLLDNNAVDLQGKLVVIGATAIGVGDRFSTVYDPILPGVEVLATGLANLTEATALIRNQGIRRIDAGAAAGLGLVGFLFGHGYWLSAVLPLAACLPPAPF